MTSSEYNMKKQQLWKKWMQDKITKEQHDLILGYLTKVFRGEITAEEGRQAIVNAHKPVTLDSIQELGI